MNGKKNILLITSDQQHHFTIGKFNPEIRTPNLDRLCDEGTYFDRAYTVNPTCTPTRASLITGKYPSQHGAWTLGTKLQEDVHTIGEDFSAAGYRTALVGKAHFQPLASTEKYPSLEAYPVLQDLPFWKSFDENFYGFEHVDLARNHVSEAHVGQHYALWMEEKGCANWRDYFRSPTGTLDRGKTLTWEIPEEYHYDTWIAERTHALLQQYAEVGESFFLWASFFDPHPDYLVPEPYASLYDPDKITLRQAAPGEHEQNSPFHRLSQQEDPDTSMYRKSGFGLHGVGSHLEDPEMLRKQVAIYYGMITMMDKYIGKILDKLDALGLAENTVVVVTTDHGHFYGHHGLTAKGPFMYEDLIKVPFIARVPWQRTKGNVSHAIQSLIDLPETFLDFCGIPLPDGTAGVSQKDVWLGAAESARDWASCEHHHERGAIHLRTYVNLRYKITVYDHMDCGDLFDLLEDPEELHNLWDDPACAELKTQMLYEFVFAEMRKEPKFMPRVYAA